MSVGIFALAGFFHGPEGRDNKFLERGDVAGHGGNVLDVSDLSVVANLGGLTFFSTRENFGDIGFPECGEAENGMNSVECGFQRFLVFEVDFVELSTKRCEFLSFRGGSVSGESADSPVWECAEDFDSRGALVASSSNDGDDFLVGGHFAGEMYG